MPMTEHPNCKINIGLSVVAKRPDGYHNLESVFYPIPISDTLEIVKADTFSFEQDGIALDCAGSDNLCVKAYRLMQKDFPQIGPVSIRLTKNIPSGAGMGGGSSDAAFTIKLGDCVPRPPNCGGQLSYSYYKNLYHLFIYFAGRMGLEPTT